VVVVVVVVVTVVVSAVAYCNVKKNSCWVCIYLDALAFSSRYDLRKHELWCNRSHGLSHSRTQSPSYACSTERDEGLWPNPYQTGIWLAIVLGIALGRTRVRRALDTRMGSHKRRSPGYEVSMTLLYSLLFPSAAFFVLFVSFPS
jgi:hypothetical protein